MATAAQSFSHALRQQIEESLAGRVHARLTLAPRLVREGFETGYETLDRVLHGGLPVSGTTEIIGSRSSGRATLAAAYLAERTREGHVCAWVDVAGDMSPEAGMADGIDLARVLWIRCSDGAAPRHANSEPETATPLQPHETSAPRPGPEAGPNLQVIASRPYRRDKSIGTPGVANRPLGETKEVRTVQVASDRQPKRRGTVVLQSRAAILPSRYADNRAGKPLLLSSGRSNELKTASTVTQKGGFRKLRRPWGRLEQAIKAVDLLVQAGGFGAIVLDMGGIPAEMARKIPLATWFRWRAALERTRTSLVVLSPYAANSSQLGCAGSSAELVLRVEANLPAPGTVMGGVPCRLEVVRRRFEEQALRRKKPAGGATAWESRAHWVAS